MSIPKADVERIRFWQGQTLRSRDLNDQLAHDASLRWWHNRAIHNTYGVVGGFRSRSVEEQVVVGPGLAYDCFGRELLSLELRSVAQPPEDEDGPESWRLVARAASDERVTPPPLELRWLPAEPPERPDQGVTVALGSWIDGEFRLQRRPQSHPIRPVSRPRLASGETVHGKTDWRAWSLPGFFGRRSATGIQVTINTSAAGFQRTPCYFASLRGDPWIQNGPQSLLVALERIVEVSPTSLVFSLWVRPTSAAIIVSSEVSIASPLVQLGRRQWSVCWLGIEASGAVFTEVSKL